MRVPAPEPFSTPHILLAAFSIDQLAQRVAATSVDGIVEFISGSKKSRARTLKNYQGGKMEGGEFTGWLPLVEKLHQNESKLQRYGCYDQEPQTGDQKPHDPLVGPAVRLHGTSWDILPPETVRPSAITTVSDIAILARWLGMSWEEFNPEGGRMRARGNGQGIFSTFARPIGILLHYTDLEGGGKSGPPIESIPSVADTYIPTRQADMMGFGILPGCVILNVPNYKLGTTADVYATMDTLDSTRKASAKLKDMNRLLVGKWDAHCMYGFSDIIALAAPMIRRRHSTIVRVPTPAEHCSSLLSHKECFVVFHN